MSNRTGVPMMWDWVEESNPVAVRCMLCDFDSTTKGPMAEHLRTQHLEELVYTKMMGLDEIKELGVEWDDAPDLTYPELDSAP